MLFVTTSAVVFKRNHLTVVMERRLCTLICAMFFFCIFNEIFILIKHTKLYATEYTVSKVNRQKIVKQKLFAQKFLTQKMLLQK